MFSCFEHLCDVYILCLMYGGDFKEWFSLFSQSQTQICSVLIIIICFPGSPAVRRSVYLTVMILMNAVLVYFYITALENEKGMIISDITQELKRLASIVLLNK